MAEQPGQAVYAVTLTGRALLVRSFVVDGILDHQAQEGSGEVGRARAAFNEGMAKVFAIQRAHMPHEEFRRLCVIAAARHVPPEGRA